LPHLAQESEGTYWPLQPLEEEGIIKVHRDRYASVDSIHKGFTEYQRVAIFHYGGHANGTQLHLVDQKTGATPLARLLAAQAPHLQLVCLNGCATYAQVEYLLDLGIPAVVATHCPIDDDKAAEFAIQFYELLAKGKTIREAFTLATNKLEAKGKLVPRDWVIERGSARNQTKNRPQNPWGLFVHPQHMKVLKWTIYDTQGLLNGELCRALMPALEPYSEEAREFIKSITYPGTQRNWWQQGNQLNKAQDTLARAFVGVVGHQFGHLAARSVRAYSHSTDYIQKSLQVVQRSLDVLNYASLSVLSDHQKGPLSEPHYQVIRDFFENTAECNMEKQLMLLRTLGEVFKQQQIPHPITEIYEFLEKHLLKKGEEESEFWQACLKLYALDERSGSLSLDKMACFTAEDYLCKIMPPLGFLANYQLSAYNTAEFQWPNADKRTYMYYCTKIQIMHDKTPKQSQMRTSEHPVNTEVVILHQGVEEEGIPLSPFWINYNVLMGESEFKICVYQSVGREEDSLRYVSMADDRDAFIKRVKNISDAPQDIEGKAEIKNDAKNAVQRRLNRVVKRFKQIKASILRKQ